MVIIPGVKMESLLLTRGDILQKLLSLTIS